MPPQASSPQENVLSASPKTQHPDGAIARVLLVEDDPLIVKMYQSKFTKEGIKVIVAEDGVKGLDLAIKEPPDLILLDLMIPRLSGIDLLAKLRADPKGKNIPVIVLTNLGGKEEVEKATQLGVKEYLMKADFTPGQVVDKVKGYLNV